MSPSMNIQLIEESEEYILTHKIALHNHPYQFQYEHYISQKGAWIYYAGLTNDANQVKHNHLRLQLRKWIGRQ